MLAVHAQRWEFYDQHNLSPGMEVFVLIDPQKSSTRGTRWRAWIWWNGAWNRLSLVTLLIYDEAFMEEYVEVYRDPNQTTHFTLPATCVHNVQVKRRPSRR